MTDCEDRAINVLTDGPGNELLFWGMRIGGGGNWASSFSTILLFKVFREARNGGKCCSFSSNAFICTVTFMFRCVCLYILTNVHLGQRLSFSLGYLFYMGLFASYFLT